MKCSVKGCANESHQGVFVGDVCKPCHTMIVTGKAVPTKADLFDIAERRSEYIARSKTPPYNLGM